MHNVPAYKQTQDAGVELGCVPTAIASIFANWDQKGYDELLPVDGWDALKDTKNVENEISSPNHRARYDPLQDDLSIIDNDNESIANFAGTSVGTFANQPMPRGGSDAADIPVAIYNYASSKGYTFSATSEEVNQDTLEDAWSVLTQEIDADRPLLAAVDAGKRASGADGNSGLRIFDGEPDHAVPVVGYDERPDGHYYGFYTNWDDTEDNNPKWEKLEPVGKDVKWGVSGLYTVIDGPILVDTRPPDLGPSDFHFIA